MMTILTLQKYYNEILILQQHFIYNVLNGHSKVPAIFQKLFWQLYKYSGNITRFQWNIIEILPQYYGAMWDICWNFFSSDWTLHSLRNNEITWYLSTHLTEVNWWHHNLRAWVKASASFTDARTSLTNVPSIVHQFSNAGHRRPMNCF